MRTLMWYISFAFTLIGTIPKLFKVNTLKNQGKSIDCEDYIHKVTSKWALGAVKRTGTCVEVYGTQNLPQEQAVVFISNHQGNFDIPILMSYVNKPKGFIAKIETQKIPVVRTWMRHIHCIFMDRSTLKGSAGAIIEGINTLKKGYSLVIFPEGTRSKSNQMGEFKSASFKLATKAKVPIIPISICGSYKIMEANHNQIKPAQVKLYIHECIETKNLSKEQIEQLPEQVYNIIKSKLPDSL
ncbi:lysophospholipid acyltransferase family protein [Cellulosilyticum sp. I15G10I2]|uniref:lysophospholipid acyltransferase family protein n=1 Tax=Cellulosilyticum sp. I15G10I2 TaxID=1892843 RepID=UPI000AD0A208|nr:1-acylglycerol-3-phosphate O-acyltransferase [Cellulosilyticum sp. I15G10I2]